jgi:hypothetical protein
MNLCKSAYGVNPIDLATSL